MHARRSCMDDTLGNALVIEMSDFFAKDKILQKRRAARIGPERVLIIGKRDALVRGERGVLSTSDLVQLSTGGRLYFSVGSRTIFLFVFSRITHCLLFAHDRSPFYT